MIKKLFFTSALTILLILPAQVSAVPPTPPQKQKDLKGHFYKQVLGESDVNTTSEKKDWQEKLNEFKAAKETYSLVKEVNLSMDRLTLKQFYVDKRPGIALERNSVFVYYLEKIVQLERITVGHIYTCYKELGVKPPAKLKQSLADTASKKGWLDTSYMNNIKITLKGESYVEHELPKS